MAQLVARLVRNEKVGGSNPPSSTTGRHPMRMSVFCMSGVVLRCLLLCCSWRRWCSGRRIVCLWAWPLCVLVGGGPPARSPHASLKARSGRSRSPPVPSGPSGALHTSGAWLLMCGSVCRFEARPGPATAHGRRSQAPPPTTGTAAWPRRCPPVRPCPPDPPALSTPVAQPEFAIELVACGSAGVPGAVGPGRPRG